MNVIADNLAQVNELIRAAEKKYGRVPGSVKLLAVSKKHSTAAIQQAYAAGQHLFGESYAQEGLSKIQELANSQIEWHFIGPIQRNKTRKIAEHFAWVHSVAEMHIAQRLNDQRPNDLPPLNICIEVNISHEATKSGVAMNAVQALAQFCQTLPRLRLRGLMAIPAPQPDFALQQNEFRKLREIFHSLCAHGLALDTLSMGMSDDFEAAIAEGTTLVRIGTAIFGARQEKN